MRKGVRNMEKVFTTWEKVFATFTTHFATSWSDDWNVSWFESCG
jgi:hypothetical protein